MGLYYGLLILSAFSIAYGVLLLLYTMAKLPDRKRKRKIKYAFKTNGFDSRITEWATELGRYLPMSSSKESVLNTKLKNAGIELSPRTYEARVLIKSSIFFVSASFVYFLTNNLGAVILTIAVGIFLFYRERREVERIRRRKKDSIEWELPRMASSILQELRHHRDVVRILENYKLSAGKDLAQELEITIADMKTGNQEVGLIRMDGRLGIAGISSIVRGLIAVMQGDDGIFYFQILEHDLKNLELQKLKKTAVKRPSKVLKYSVMIVVSIIMIYGVMFALQFITAFKTLKG